MDASTVKALRDRARDAERRRQLEYTHMLIGWACTRPGGWPFKLMLVSNSGFRGIFAHQRVPLAGNDDESIKMARALVHASFALGLRRPDPGLLLAASRKNSHERARAKAATVDPA